MIKFDTTDPATNANKKLDHNKFNSKTATDIVRNTTWKVFQLKSRLLFFKTFQQTKSQKIEG